MRNQIHLTCIRLEISASSSVSEIPDVLYPNMAAVEYMFMRLLYIDLYSDLEMCVWVWWNCVSPFCFSIPPLFFPSIFRVITSSPINYEIWWTCCRTIGTEYDSHLHAVNRLTMETRERRQWRGKIYTRKNTERRRGFTIYATSIS